MHLTVYTDYTLRVMIYLTLRYGSGEVATIDEMAQAYGISRNHLMKIVNELSQSGFIETTRGRSGGARLARAPNHISLGEVVRMAEKDFAVVQCQERALESACAVFQACNLKRALRRAVDAFMEELDKVTFQDAVSAPTVAASLLGMAGASSATVIPARGYAATSGPAVSAEPSLPARRRRQTAKSQ